MNENGIKSFAQNNYAIIQTKLLTTLFQKDIKTKDCRKLKHKYIETWKNDLRSICKEDTG